MALVGSAACTAFRERPTSQVGLTIGYGQSVIEDGITITFRDVLEDTRCPPTEICQIPGNARLEFRAHYPDGTSKTIVIDTGFGTPQQPLADGVLLRVNDVQPPRFRDTPLVKDDYTVAIELIPA